MKLLSLILVASVAGANYAHAQTATQTPSTSAPSSSSSSEHLGHACKEEVHKLCGHAHGQEMQNCIKSELDLNHFSADCRAKLAAAKPKS